MASKSVLIIGASSGIGEALGYEYARQNALRKEKLHIILAARRLERLEAIKTKLLEQYSENLKVSTAKIDISVEEDVLFANLNKAVSVVGGVPDSVVVNSGIAWADALTADSLGADCWKHQKKVLEVNFLNAVSCSAWALNKWKTFVAENKGTTRSFDLIGVTSVMTYFNGSPFVPYATSKLAFQAFLNGLRVEVQALQLPVKIHEAKPGLVASEMTEKITSSLKITSEACAKSIYCHVYGPSCRLARLVHRVLVRPFVGYSYIIPFFPYSIFTFLSNFVPTCVTARLLRNTTLKVQQSFIKSKKSN